MSDPVAHITLSGENKIFLEGNSIKCSCKEEGCGIPAISHKFKTKLTVTILLFKTGPFVILKNTF